ncbi:50S ribosomal protein L37ae [Candidatus Woesearchaeota archaeon CG10_big_fil_rev_8_21_14_0_10_30_7]|nr:MAG: 50S ribosomal protein L37ae [Candidatus Woesearchaeota archaeon CG10_big_fil_rev_8_21_14_0_10_30_7]
MAKKPGLGSVKRFGVRYGRTTKHRLAKIERAQKAPQKCPYCSKLGVKRLAVGIFSCPKCKSKFTGKAFTVSAPLLHEEVENKIVEKVQVDEDEELEVQKW